MIIGTAGHIDHGKSSLVRALTGIDTDRLKEEKARGISIDLGFAYLAAEGAGEKAAPDDVLGFVDVPGHEKFVHTMVAGAGGIDFALLVVACDDGVMPQTREHLAILDLIGVRAGAVALTKADLVDEARILEVEEEARLLLAPTGLAEAPFFPVSAVTGLGIPALAAAIEAARRHLARRSDKGRFRLSVDRAFTLSGAGTVVTGTVLSGRVKVGDQVVVSPKGITARVRSIRAQDRAAEEGVAGQRCGINLVGEGISKEAISRGDMVLDPVLHAPADHVDATLHLLSSEAKPVSQWFPVRLHHAAREVGARVVLLGDPIAPGGTGLVQLVMEQPIAAAAGDRYVLRDTSARRTIGGGTFLDLRGPARKRRTPERIAQLEALASPGPAEALGRFVALAPFFVDLSAFARDHALGADEAEALSTALDLVRIKAGGTEFALAPGAWRDYRALLLSTLDAFHADNPDLAGMGRERLRLALAPSLPAPLFLAVLQWLARAGDISLDGAWVRLSGFEARLTETDEALWREIGPRLSAAERFRPPRVRDIAGLLGAGEAEVRRLLKLMGRMGKVDEVAHDHFFLRGTVAEMVDIMRRLSEARPKGEFTAALFRDQVGNGRKVAIQILEFFDRHGVTLRRGDLRRLNPHRLDLFGGPPAPPSEGRDADAVHGTPAPHAPSGEASTPPPNTTKVIGREASLVGRPDFKSGRGREPVLGGFDSHSLPPSSEASDRPRRPRSSGAKAH